MDHRQEIYEAISEMLDNPDECGIYPTTKCYDRLEAYCKCLIPDAMAAEKQIATLLSEGKIMKAALEAIAMYEIGDSPASVTATETLAALVSEGFAPEEQK